MPSLSELSSALANLVQEHAPSLVSVQGVRSRSSGFVWREGFVVTADEALPDEETVSVVLPDGRAVSAAVAGRDPTTDIALLKTETSGTKPVVLASEPVRAGALALALGSEDGVTAAFGVVAVSGPAWRSMRGGEIDQRIELDLRLRDSAEGGLAVDAQGAAFGMTVLGPRRRALVIPAATIERVAARLQSSGRIGRGYLGLALQPVKTDDGAKGAMVMGVEAGGPGARAGVRQGDVITAWNGEPVTGIRALLGALGPESVGRTVALKLLRGGEPSALDMTIGERPAA